MDWTKLMKKSWAVSCVFSLLTCIAVCLPNVGHAAPWVLDWYGSTEAPDEREVQELETKVKAGDWRLRTEFAAAYLYGCEKVKYGNRCRVLEKRRLIGAASLRMVLDAVPGNDREKQQIAAFQEYYAWQQYSASGPKYLPANENCLEAVQYAKKSVENGRICAAEILRLMTNLGRCLQENIQVSDMYARQTRGCLIP